MLRRIVVIALVFLLPTAFYVAYRYGTPNEVTYAQAATKVATAEGDQAPKVIVVSTVAEITQREMYCTDKEGERFKVDFTGTAPEKAFTPGQIVRFVGHVHSGSPGYFHATQVYAQ